MSLIDIDEYQHARCSTCQTKLACSTIIIDLIITIQGAIEQTSWAVVVFADLALCLCKRMNRWPVPVAYAAGHTLSRHTSVSRDKLPAEVHKWFIWSVKMLALPNLSLRLFIEVLQLSVHIAQLTHEGLHVQAAFLLCRMLVLNTIRFTQTLADYRQNINARKVVLLS